MPRQRQSADPPAPRDRLARTLKWVGAVTSILSFFYDPSFEHSKRPSRDLYLATLQEAAGRPEDALRTLQSVRSKLTPNASGSLSRALDAGIARLSKQPAQRSNAR